MENASEKIGVRTPEIPSGAQVAGVGIDLESVSRIRDAATRHGDAFLSKVFFPEEIELCRSRGAHVWESLAARWAAKEAFSKALGTGIGETVGFTDFAVLSDAHGAPRPVFSPHGRAALHNAGANRALVSLTHTADFAEAIVILLS